MSSAEAVGALPGGAAFVALWKQVDGDAGAIGDMASSLSKAGSEVGQVRSAVTKSVHGVAGGWDGPAADAFTGYMGKVTSASQHLDSALGKSAASLRTAATEVSAARERLDGIASRLLDQTRGIATDNVSFEPFVEELVQQACAEAKPVVTALSQHLASAASGLSGALDGGGFTHLHPPGEGSYLPKKGGHIDWSAVPKDGSKGKGATAPASAGGGSSAGGGAGGGASGGSSGGSSSGGSSSGGPPAKQPTGKLKDWIEEATDILVKHGVPRSKINAADINMMIQHESSGNPHAQNNSDSNAAAGHPSKGIMQTIDSTFQANALPGHKDIWNPVDNIVAGVRYAIGRYGSLDNVPGVKAVHNGGAYVGY